jgi:hypothetical protein
MLPDGQLRSFARNAEQVDVFKKASLTGPGEFYRKFDIEDSTSTDLVFAANETITDARAANEASCQIAVRVEYHYDPVGDELDVRPEKVKTAMSDGRCIVVDRRPVPPIKLTRVDQGTGETRETRAPVGVPIDVPELTQVGDDGGIESSPPDKKSFDVKRTNIKDEEAKKLQAQRDRQARDQGLNLVKKLPPPPTTKQKKGKVPPKGDEEFQQADGTDAGSDAPKLQNAPNVPNAPPQQVIQPPPQQAPAKPQVQTSAPRGDSQVAPQAQPPDTDAQQQAPSPRGRKE